MPQREPCAYCRRRDADDRYRPFCSERCKMADLGRWLAGDYRVPGHSASGPSALEPAHPDYDDEDDVPARS